MVRAQVIGNDATIAIAGQSGNFQLNVMLPVIAYNLLQSIELLANASRALADCRDRRLHRERGRARRRARAQSDPGDGAEPGDRLREGRGDRQAGLQARAGRSATSRPSRRSSRPKSSRELLDPRELTRNGCGSKVKAGLRRSALIAAGSRLRRPTATRGRNGWLARQRRRGRLAGLREVLAIRRGGRRRVLLRSARAPDGLTVLLTQRAAHLKDHAGQVSLPGGRHRGRRRAAARSGAARGAGGGRPVAGNASRRRLSLDPQLVTAPASP